MAMLVVKNGHPKDTCYYEIGQYVPNIVIILNYAFFHNWEGWLACSLLETENFQFKLLITFASQLQFIHLGMRIFEICNCSLDEHIPELIH